MKLHRFLVPIDFSESAEHALGYALQLARMVGAEITLLHVFQPPTMHLPDGAYAMGSDVLGGMLQASREELEAVARRSLGQDVPLHTELVEGSPALEITRFAGDRGFDLIVIGTNGRTGLSHLFVGSVAERVVRTSAVPVLAVRRPAT